jgi:calcium-dependent protein kinase
VAVALCDQLLTSLLPFRPPLLHPPPPPTHTQAFKQLDKDGSGTISLEELAEALRTFGIYDDAKDLLASADTNDDGQIDYAEFSWLLRNNNENLRASARGASKKSLAKFF